MSDLDKLRATYEQAEAKAQKLMADKDQALTKIQDRYATRLQDANDQAAAAQQQLRDAEAASALAGREDGRAIANALGLTATADMLGIELLPLPEPAPEGQ